MSKMMSSANFLWNYIVAFSRRYYKFYGKQVTYDDLKKHIKKIFYKRPFKDELITYLLDDYFSTINKYLKFPRLNKKCKLKLIKFSRNEFHVQKSMNNEKHGIVVVNSSIFNGNFKFKITRDFVSPLNIKIFKDIDNRFYVLILCDVQNLCSKSVEKYRGTIGIDFGLKTFLTLSTGEKIDMPDFFSNSYKKLSNIDRTYQRKKCACVYGSSFRRTKRERQKIYRHIKNQRSDYHWKLANELCLKNSFISVEDLDLNEMKKKVYDIKTGKMRKRFGRKVSSLAYGKFLIKLNAVAEKYGTIVYKIDRYFPSSQKCSVCGHRDNKTKNLGVREWVCQKCGTKHDRDINAARNILLRGVRKSHGKGIPRSCKGRKCLGTLTNQS